MEICNSRWHRWIFKNDNFLEDLIKQQNRGGIKTLQDWCKKTGLPARISSDYGLENVGIVYFILAAHKTSSFLTGTSVHNQRIERLWQEVFESFIQPFYNHFMHFLLIQSCYVLHFTFYLFCIHRKLEQEGLLDQSNDFDMMCLHLCVGQFLSAVVGDFLELWNRHLVQTDGNRIPLQVFYVGYVKSNNNVKSNKVKRLDKKN